MKKMEQDYVIRMYKAGKSVEQICERMGLDQNEVEQVLVNWHARTAQKDVYVGRAAIEATFTNLCGHYSEVGETLKLLSSLMTPVKTEELAKVISTKTNEVEAFRIAKELEERFVIHQSFQIEQPNEQQKELEFENG